MNKPDDASVDEIVELIAAKNDADGLQSYLSCGRRFSGLSEADLSHQYLLAMRHWAEAISTPKRYLAVQDLTSTFAEGARPTGKRYRPPERVERLYHADRADKIWTEAHVAAFMAVAPEMLQRALVLALETGQRQGDILVLPWSAYDGTWIRLRQSKTGRKVEVPVTRCLRAVLDAMPRISPVMLTNSRGLPWRSNAFRKSWGAVTRQAGVKGLTFHDLRGTAVTRLSEAECTPQEIATITGHSLRDVAAILDCYSARTNKIALAAIAKLERSKQ